MSSCGLPGEGAADEVICEVIRKLDALNDLAVALKDEALQSLADLRAAGEGSIDGIQNINYAASVTLGDYSAPDAPDEPDYSALGPTSPSFPTAPVITDPDPVDAAPTVPSGYSVPTAVVDTAPALPTEYTIGSYTVGTPPTVSGYAVGTVVVDTAPTVPAAYDVPAASGALISSTVIDDIFDRASARLARVSVKAERDASYMAAGMGLGLPSSALLLRLGKAQQETNERTSEAALEQSIQEGVWKREDVKVLHGMHIQNWPQKPELDLRSWQSKEQLDVTAYTAETDANIRGATANASILMDGFRTVETVGIDAYKAETDANIRGWPLKPELSLRTYQAYQGLTLDAFKSEVDGNIRNWPLQPGLEEQTWKDKETLDVEQYRAANVNKTQAYSTVVDGLSKAYSTQVTWVLGYLDAEGKRYAARLDGMRTNVASEAERRGWDEMKMRNALEQADKATGYAIEKAKTILEVQRQTEEAIAQLMVGLAQGVFSAANYNLQGSGSQAVTESIAS